MLPHCSTLISTGSWIMSCMDSDTFNNHSLHFNILANPSPVLHQFFLKWFVNINYFIIFLVLCLRAVSFAISLSREYKLRVWSHTTVVIIYTLCYPFSLWKRYLKFNASQKKKMKTLWELQALVTELAANSSLTFWEKKNPITNDLI